MILLVDIGNSRIKWCGYSEEYTLGECYAISHGNEIIPQHLDESWSSLERPESVYLISVANNEIESVVRDCVAAKWSLSVHVLVTKSHCAGVHNGYQNPYQLGVDRWAAIIGAYTITKQATCIVDCGTALTCDAVDSSGLHLGGFVVPGRRLQQQVLLQGTAGITLEDADFSHGGWGRDTNSCVTSGILQSHLGLIERCIQLLQDNVDGPLSVVLTGGDADVLVSHLPATTLLVPDLVFHGMTYMIMEYGS